MEKDKKAMKEKLSKEEEERQRQEEEMKKKLRQQQEQSENEIINLYKVKLDENNKTKINFFYLKKQTLLKGIKLNSFKLKKAFNTYFDYWLRIPLVFAYFSSENLQSIKIIFLSFIGIYWPIYTIVPSFVQLL